MIDLEFSPKEQIPTQIKINKTKTIWADNMEQNKFNGKI